MELTVGAVLEGKVKSITNFGAFVTLPENKTGMVHISEVANAYVSDIRQHLTEGQDVKVMVIGNENGKINLSIKRTLPKPERPARGPRPGGGHPAGAPHAAAPQPRGPRPQQPLPPSGDQSFEDKLKQFLSSSDLNRSLDSRRGGRRRR